MPKLNFSEVDSKELLGKLLEAVQEDAKGPLSCGEAQTRAGELRKQYDIFTQRHDFEVGQLVCWKEGLKHKKRPRQGEPAVVIGVLEEPILAPTDEPGSPYFREPLDLVLGVLDEDGDFMTFHYDSRRFEPFQDDLSSSESSSE